MYAYSNQTERNYSDRYWDSVADATYERLGIQAGDRKVIVAPTMTELELKLSQFLDELPNEPEISEIYDYSEEQGADRFQVELRFH